MAKKDFTKEEVLSALTGNSIYKAAKVLGVTYPKMQSLIKKHGIVINNDGKKSLNVRIKKLHPNSVIPTYAHDTDAGMDLTAVSRTIDEYGNVFYGFGLAFEIPKGYVGLIFPRSSIYKSNLLLTNAVGVIDSGYRGEVSAKFAARDNVVSYESFWCRLKQFFTGQPQDDSRNIGVNTTSETYKIGERIAQMIIVPYPKVTFEEVDELSDSERGNNGYGSSGKK